MSTIRVNYHSSDEKEEEDGDFNFVVKESEIEECEIDTVEQYVLDKVY
jgi:hypothetical protein